MKSKPSWPNAAAPSAGLLRAAAASVHSLPSAPRVQKLLIICSHLLQTLSQTLNELTDLFLVSVYWLRGFIPQSPLGFSNFCTYSRGLFRHSSGAACSSAFSVLENRKLLWRARDTQEFSSKSSAASRLFEVLKDSEEDDETGPEHCTAQSRDQMHLPSKGA